MSDVFISYARADRAIAEPIKAKLEALGLAVFFDIDGGIDPGEPFPVRIGDAVTGAKAVLALWTPHALTREWCRKECHLAQQLGKLVPAAAAGLSAADLREFAATSYEDLCDFDGQEKHLGWSQVLFAIAKRMDRWAQANATDNGVGGVIERAAAARLAAVAARPAGAAPSAIGHAGATAVYEKVNKDDVADLLNFAETFPGSAEAYEARRRATKLKAWEEAWAWLETQPAASAHTGAFLERWGDHPHAEQVRRRHESLLAEEASVETRRFAEQKQREADRLALLESTAREAHARAEAQQWKTVRAYRRVRMWLQLLYPLSLVAMLVAVIMTSGMILDPKNWQSSYDRRPIISFLWAAFLGTIVFAISASLSTAIWYASPFSWSSSSLVPFVALALGLASYWIGGLVAARVFTSAHNEQFKTPAVPASLSVPSS